MVMAFDLSVRLGWCPADDAARVRRHLAEIGLPVRPSPRHDADALVARMHKDKKARAGRINFILARGIGRSFVTKDVDLDVVHALLRSEEHTSELQSLMRISYAVFCLQKKKHK